MAFDWNEYLKLAAFLKGDEVKYLPEAGIRSAISRAYYAAYCYARNFAVAKHSFIVTGKADDHDLLIRHLTARGMATIANNLASLRTWRNKCDYDNNVNINLNTTVQFAILQSQKIFADLK